MSIQCWAHIREGVYQPVSGRNLACVGDPTMADAILDRIVHNSHKITLKGKSMRKLLFDMTDTEPEL